jgi:hypothetical protein
MKAGVENGNLRDSTEQFHDKFHAFELGAVVERCKNGNLFDGGLDLVGNERGFEMERAAVDYPVAYDIDFGWAGDGLRLASPQSLEQALDGLHARIDQCLVFYGDTAGIFDGVMSMVVDPFNLALPQAGGWIVGDCLSDFVETTLLAAGTGVEN